MKRIGVIVNPASGNGAGKAEGEKVITELQRETEVLDLTGNSLDESRAKAQAAINDLLIDGLVVVGGDGMAHLGINLCADADLPLGIVAAGTGNDAARALGLPIGDAIAGARVVLNNLRQPRQVDLVRAESTTGAFWYFGSLSVDFVALVNQRANIWKWPKGPSRYKWAMIAELARIGNNVNQIARALNSDEEVSTAMLEELCKVESTLTAMDQHYQSIMRSQVQS